ncbi:hypothetical protein [uncultured Abyssibacter sp.]|uniref:hypothetical protein n=1 Tax=uncultured Abyssibacter sp. TaxID=2320202 RepID=UPI0032B16F73
MSKRLIAAACLAVLPVSAMAVDLDLPVGGDQDDFRGVGEDLSAAVAYRSASPAETGGLLGFDVGALFSYTSVENSDSWQSLVGEDPSGLGFVSLVASKGIPLINVEVGAQLGLVPGTDVTLFGGEARYSFVSGNVAIPAVSLRVAYQSATGEDDIEAEALSYDVSISKGFVFATPYVGYGRVDSEVTTDVAGYEDEDYDLDRVFGGVRFSLAIMKITAEAEKIGDNSAFNLRLAFGF